MIQSHAPNFLSCFVTWGTEYIPVMTFLVINCRSILTTPWLEFGGDCVISCAKTGYSSKIEFHTKVSCTFFIIWEYSQLLITAISRRTKASYYRSHTVWDILVLSLLQNVFIFRHDSENKPFMKLEGNWNSVIYKKISKDVRLSTN